MLNPLELLENLSELLGEGTLLLPVEPGGTECLTGNWVKASPEKMSDEQYRCKLLTSNIGVRLGKQSAGLVSIEFNDEDAAAEFLRANPKLEGTLQTRGSRGRTLWLRMDGDYPNPTRIMHAPTGSTVGEWRSTGKYSIIAGEDATGAPYTRIVDGPVVRIKFEDIRWPCKVRLHGVVQSLPKIAGQTFGETMIQNRRKLVMELLDGVEWIGKAEARCSCPGLDLHTDPNAPCECRVRIDGVPKLFCSHTPCTEKVKIANRVLRRAVQSQEVVLLPDGTVRTGEAAERLYSVLSASGEFYLRSGVVSEIVSGPYGPQMQPVDKIRAISTFERFVSFGKRKVKEDEEFVRLCPLPENVAAIFLQSDEKALLPPVDAIVTIPILYRDAATGSLHVHHNGYNAQSRTYVANPDPQKQLPTVTLDEARSLLLDLLSDFNFEGRSHRSRALASFITPAMVFSGLLGGRPPVDVAEADQSQSGKNFRHKLICHIYGETPRPITQRRGGVGGLDESIAEALIRGKPFPQLDNLRGRLDSPFLESFLTADTTASARGFGRGEIEVGVGRFCTLITSNDLQFTQDLANRCSIVRIRKQPDNYAWKNYDGLRLDEHVKLHQPRYLAAVYRIVQEWYDRGRQELHRDHHDFRWWAGRMDWIIENLFPGEAPLLDGHRSVQSRAGTPQLGWWQGIAFEVENQGLLDQPLQMWQVRDLCLEAGMEVYRKPGQEHRIYQNDEAELKALGVLFAPLFRNGPLGLDGFTVQKKEALAQRTSTGTDYSVKTYVFSRTGQTGGQPSPVNPLGPTSPPCQSEPECFVRSPELTFTSVVDEAGQDAA